MFELDTKLSMAQAAIRNQLRGYGGQLAYARLYLREAQSAAVLAAAANPGRGWEMEQCSRYIDKALRNLNAGQYEMAQRRLSAARRLLETD